MWWIVDLVYLFGRRWFSVDLPNISCGRRWRGTYLGQTRLGEEKIERTRVLLVPRYCAPVHNLSTRRDLRLSGSTLAIKPLRDPQVYLPCTAVST